MDENITQILLIYSIKTKTANFCLFRTLAFCDPFCAFMYLKPRSPVLPFNALAKTTDLKLNQFSFWPPALSKPQKDKLRIGKYLMTKFGSYIKPPQMLKFSFWKPNECFCSEYMNFVSSHSGEDYQLSNINNNHSQQIMKFGQQKYKI